MPNDRTMIMLAARVRLYLRMQPFCHRNTSIHHLQRAVFARSHEIAWRRIAMGRALTFGALQQRLEPPRGARWSSPCFLGTSRAPSISFSGTLCRCNAYHIAHRGMRSKAFSKSRKAKCIPDTGGGSSAVLEVIFCLGLNRYSIKVIA